MSAKSFESRQNGAAPTRVAAIVKTLREHLRYMCKELNVPAHPGYLLELPVKGYPHSVRVLSEELPGIELDDLTCFGYALRMHESLRWSEMSIETHVLNSRFMEVLIEEGTLECTEKPANDDLVVYHRKRISHAGIVASDRVISKWGIGCVYEHPLWEVPLQYGSSHAFYRRPQLSVVEEAFYRLRKKHDILYFNLFHADKEESE